jgi:hypothetical protein
VINITAPNPESLSQQGSAQDQQQSPPPPAAPTQDLSVAQFMEMINALPDRVAEAMQQKLAVKPPAQEEAKQTNGSEKPGGKFFGFPSFAAWFAGDKGSQ